jgi:hypothetical protein
MIPEWCRDPLDTHGAAVGYFREGLTPLRLPPRSKAIYTEGWQDTHYDDEEELDSTFPAEMPGNIGILLGTGSAARPLDADLDCAEAIRVASRFLPPTRRVSGRAGAPKSHYWYQAAGSCANCTKFIDPCADKDATLVELRSSGGQTVVPPSIHPEGEAYVWYEFGEPGVVEYEVLLRAVSVVAAAALLARYWPGPESHKRQDTAMAVAGGLLRAGWTVQQVATFLDAVCVAAGDPDVRQRCSVVAPAAVRLAQKETVVGWPRLAELLGDKGDKVVSKAREWLGLRDSSPAAEPASSTTGTSPTGPLKKFELGPLLLQPGQPRQMPSGRITLPVNVTREGRIVYPFVLSSAASSHKEPDRLLRQFLGEDPAAPKIASVLTEILADAATRLAQQGKPEGPTVREIVAGKVPKALQLVCRSERGLWSETLGEEVHRCDIIAFTPDWLITECGRAGDAPRDGNGRANRADLVRVVQIELGIVWADLLSTLPLAAAVDLGRETERGRQFGHAMIRLWKTPQTWEKQATATSDTATKASLASRVATKFQKRGQDRIKWEAVHPACDAWWRPHVFPGGELRPLLGMRWTLPGQVGIALPGVTDEDSLTRLGKRFGILGDPPEGVPSRLSGGKNRLAVLTTDFCEELLETPSEDAEENPRDPGAEG